MKPFREYIKRIGKARGFGIQSPWAFSFVTEVIGERLPYYAYDDIDRRYASARERRFQKLVLRVRNFVYPHSLVIEDAASIDTLDSIAKECGTKGAFILRGIYASPQAAETWQNVKADDRIGITFDLYDFAICFLDRDIYKQHYRLNW